MHSTTFIKNPLKRKRVVLPIETKLQIVERVMNGEAYTKLSSEYGIGAQTCRDIFKNRYKLVHFAFNSGTVGECLKRKTVRKPNFHDIDKAVYQWFQEQRAEGIPITGPMLIERALFFHKEMKIEEPFSASSGWLAKFKARYNIRQPRAKDDKLVAHEPLIDKFKTEFKKIVKQNNFTLDQIYLADEKVLKWSILRDNEKLFDGESFSNSSCQEMTRKEENAKNDSITVMACANANGSNKLKLFCTGKQEFTYDSDSALVNYYTVSNDEDSYEKAVQDWFNTNFIPQVKKDLNEKSLSEKAMLVIKNSDNNIVLEENEVQIVSENNGIFIMYLPKIISELPQMSLSSKNIIKHYIDSKLIPMIEDSNCIKNENYSYDISLNETFSVISEAWNNIKFEHMQHSSWWWHNLFTEMEKEGIIDLRESITRHFMTLLDNVIADPCKSSFFTTIVDNSRIDVENSHTIINENKLDHEKRLHIMTTVDNIKSEIKEESDINLEENNSNSQEDENSDFTTNVFVKREDDEFEMQSDSNENTENLQNRFQNNNNNDGELNDILKTGICEKQFSPCDSLIFKTENNHLVTCSPSKVVTTSDAVSCTDLLLKYLEQQSDSCYNDILVVKNIRKKLNSKLRNNSVNY